MPGAKQTISVITFRKSNTNSLERRAVPLSVK